MALFITQCPHCHTTFRTSVSQLQSADGMVQCGACLRIFVADDHLLPSADLQTLDKPLGAANDSNEADDENALKEHEAQQSIEVPEVPEPVFTFVESSEPPASNDADAPAPHTDSLGAAQPDARPETEDAKGQDEPLSAEPILAAGRTDSLQEAPAFSAVDDFVFLDEPSPDAPAATVNKQQLDTIAAATATLEFDWEGNAGQKSRSGWWSFFAAVLFSTLCLQAIHWQWDELGQNDALRPWLERLCSTLPCVLKQRVDLQSMRTENLLVHSHPEIANALRVTLTLRNDSAFDQDWPLLNLRFTDADNVAVAQRQFSPTHYLPPELHGLQSMPSGTPVQVALDIIDPGIRAINYEVSFSAGTAL